MSSPNFLELLRAIKTKRSVFVSYHHDNDQPYYNSFVSSFDQTYDCITDSSLDRAIDSDDPDYVIQRIRDKYITGTSCTIVLCGPETRWRKYVDWEIKATLDKEHGLVAVLLPNNPVDASGGSHKPDRLQDNIDSGFAVFTLWATLVAGGPVQLTTLIERAIASPKWLIRNSRQLRARNG